MKKLLTFSGLIVATAILVSQFSVVRATNTEHPICDFQHLQVLPHPDPRDWNYTGEFEVTNTASFPMTFDWLLDIWGNTTDDKEGTTTLQPGESKVYGLGNICPKWQFDVTCNGQQWGAIVESHESACTETTPAVTPTPTPQPTVVPTPTEEIVVTATPTPTEEIVVTLTPTPTEVTPTPVNPTPTESSSNSNDSGSNDSHSESDTVQVQSASGSRSDILGATALADTGVFEDTFAVAIGIVGMFFTAAGYVLYAKRTI